MLYSTKIYIENTIIRSSEHKISLKWEDFMWLTSVSFSILKNAKKQPSKQTKKEKKLSWGTDLKES